MIDEKKLVEQYVRARLRRWQGEKNEHLLRAELASLRRGIGRRPGELPELWGLLLDELPEELMSRTGEPTYAEWAVSGALTLYALHSQGAREAHADGQSLGRALYILACDDRLEAVQRRFSAFATARSMPECMHHLRGLVSQLRSAEIPLDYVRLAGDLYEFQTHDGAARVRLRWGQDFYRDMNKDGKDDNNEQ